MALAYGCTGPDAARLARPRRRATRTGTCARSSRTAATRPTTSRRSFRRSPRYRAYRTPDAVLGDCWHRFYVRMLEVVESIKLVRAGLATLSDGSGLAPHRAAAPPAGGRSLCRDRMPARARWASTSSAAPTKDRRAAARAGPSSSFCNLSVTNEICRRLPDRRRAGHCGVDRYCHGRDRSLG